MTIVFESLRSDPPNTLDFTKTAKHLFDGLYYLQHKMEFVHGLINPDSIVWSHDGDLKLCHWPIHFLTDGGVSLGSKSIIPPDVSFVAPEQVRSQNKSVTQTCDIWSASLTLLKLIKPSCKIPENPCRIAFCNNSTQVLDLIEGHLSDNIIPDATIWNHFFRRSLEPNPKLRASLHELYSIINLEKPKLIENLSLVPLNVNEFEIKAKESSYMNVAEIYYLWRLSFGRNFESEQRQDDFPPIFKIPYLIVSEKQIMPESEPRLSNHVIIDQISKLIPLEKFKMDIDKLDSRIFHPLVLTDVYVKHTHHPVKQDSNSSDEYIEKDRKPSKPFTFADLDTVSIKSNIQCQIQDSSKTLPVVIKEANFAYQCERMALFKRLLGGHPYLKEQLIREASIDIPPYYRAQVWSTLLGINRSKSEELYSTIDKTASVGTERQINVDIPRCHQYNDLMASPQGHLKLSRVLKAWLNHNSTNYVYWQGLDSLVAPFLLLNFDNEAMAFACFNAFVDKYLRGMFQKENQLIVQQYLTMFSELLSYHDPSLATHLDKLGFLPNLYAIPWFLTMFTHVLPLHKILHVWDCLMLGDEKYPLCIGLAILNQLRGDLLEFNFNDCLGVFSDLPEIDIERCMQDANHFYSTTPDRLINLK